MGGGLLQIAIYGNNDLYITNDPQITFFKTVYRRYTNFSVQPYELTFNDKPTFGQKGRLKLQRIGDLVTKMYLKIILGKIHNTEPKAKFAWVRRIGHAIIKKIDIEIGGMLIDRHYGTWLDIWYELTHGDNGDNGYAKIIGDVDELTTYNSKSKREYTLYVPLQFWFNRHWGLALPLIAIQYHDVFINVELEQNDKLLIKNDAFNQTCNLNDIKVNEVSLVTEFIFLDIDERKRFATNMHEYLIEQIQFHDNESVTEEMKRMFLYFNFPTKEIIWALKLGKYTNGYKYLCYSNKDDWTDEIIKCSRKILHDSMILIDSDETFMHSGKWEQFGPMRKGISCNGNYKVNNQSSTKTLWINTDSLNYNGYSLTNKICAKIYIDECDKISIYKIESYLNARDVSIPVDELIDTRITKDDVYIYQFNNYGIYIDGTCNPITHGLLEYNGENRVDKRNSNFFGVLQPYLHHSNTPCDGINLYSFALEPERLQPSGTSNLSKIENVILSLWFNMDDANNVNYVCDDNRLFIYAFSYNIFRIMSGMTGIVYK